MTTPMEQLERDFGALFSNELGRRVLQHICETAGVYEAPAGLSGEERCFRDGARGLALDICMLAGALPEVPGSGGRELANRPDTAATGPVPPEGDGLEEAVI